MWEPEPTGSGNRVVPDGLDFAGRPQLAARLRGAGGGRSLLLNGHIDAVSAEPVGPVDEPPASSRRSATASSTAAAAAT